MSTVQQLLSMIDLMYPNALSNTDKVLFMNMAQTELSPYFGVVVEDSSLLTVADQDTYAFPTGLTDVSQIISLGIGIKEVPESRFGYVKYDIITRDDYPEGSNVYFQIVNSTGVKKLVLQPKPNVADLPIRIRFRKALTDLSATALTSSPDFDARFHMLLAYYACHMICSIGASPDVLQANNFMQKWESGIADLWKFKLEQEVTSPTYRRDNPHWRGRRRHASYSYAAPEADDGSEGVPTEGGGGEEEPPS